MRRRLAAVLLAGCGGAAAEPAAVIPARTPPEVAACALEARFPIVTAADVAKMRAAFLDRNPGAWVIDEEQSDRAGHVAAAKRSDVVPDGSRMTPAALKATAAAFAAKNADLLGFPAAELRAWRADTNTIDAVSVWVDVHRLEGFDDDVEVPKLFRELHFRIQQGEVVELTVAGSSYPALDLCRRPPRPPSTRAVIGHDLLYVRSGFFSPPPPVLVGKVAPGDIVGQRPVLDEQVVGTERVFTLAWRIEVKHDPGVFYFYVAASDGRLLRDAK